MRYLVDVNVISRPDSGHAQHPGFQEGGRASGQSVRLSMRPESLRKAQEKKVWKPRVMSHK